jgi:hypothetical protein
VIHTIQYYGHFDTSFRELTPTTTTYRTKDGKLKKGRIGPASKHVTGFKFRYMERTDKEFVAVGVESIVLRAPVLLAWERHTDGKGAFNDPMFGDESAMHLLVDMIVANPEYRDTLGLLLRRLHP